METKKIRTVYLYKNYFADFFNKQRPKVKEKIIWTLKLIEDLPRIPRQFLKLIEGTAVIYEIRIQLGKDIFRIFCFFDQDNLVVLANGFQKKT
ncbi:type II toxin-antitoxin system RelE/ParE family toxin [Pedobacter flavus]|uniref:Type II toxin-antitoxin system RelE/ParE family toxin n=1 Tax=Pedobacter flavus TaxID=3113906 RepID=A0ABU7H3W2_9SPHI|nr:type II toxin-antitoxin system RelE/ParE family toxin [Pedobacter sp. VNH31]MEE1885271.1 type II toxin-antitoxin system RelE/ParE family toxin [Pedobacter sp. VNH31]